MNGLEIAGIVASIFTGISLFPQLLKIIREKDATGVSWLMLTSLFLGLGLWIVYGVGKKDYIIIVSNAFAWIINILVIILTVRYRSRPK